MHDALMAAVREHPEDEGAWAVLQDWLLLHDDPRGRLARDPELLAELAPGWLGCPVRVEGARAIIGESGPFGRGGHFEFQRGHLHKLTVSAPWDEPMQQVVQRVLSQPVGQLLLEVELVTTPTSPSPMQALVAQGPLAIRTLHHASMHLLGPEGGPAELFPLWSGAPWLERASFSGNFRLGLARHERLRSLELSTAGWPGPLLRELGSVHLPGLYELVLSFGHDGQGERPEPGDLQALLDCALPSLRRVSLQYCPCGPELVPRLLRARWLPALEVLDLSKTRLTDQGGQLLLDGADALRHLERLDLTRCALSEDLRARLKVVLGERVIL